MNSTKTNRRFWLAMALAPLAFYALALFRDGASVIALDTFLSGKLGFLNSTSNIVLTLLNDMFGTGGILPCFADSAFPLLISWWVYLKLAHIVVDLLTVLPDMIVDLIELFTRRKDNDKM